MLNIKYTLDRLLLSLGFTEDYTPTYSLNKVGDTLIEQIDFASIPDSGKDIVWLSNKLTKALGSVKDNCIDNVRVCHSVDGRMTSEYRSIQDGGCCGYYDQKVKNEVTGNTYWIGFNYGH